MKLLLIAPDSFEFGYTIDKVSTTSKAFNEVLKELKAKEGVEVLIIPAEQTISDCNNANFSGIELIKHIRLTPELKNINKLAIVLLHWHSIDYYITKDQENIFLYSPGIYNYRLPHSKIDFTSLKDLAFNESLKPYLFGSENDESISDHVFRNEIAIQEFKEQILPSEISFIGKPLSYKKLFHKNFLLKSIHQNFDKKFNLKANILLIDDKANEWEAAIKTIYNQDSTTITKIDSVVDFDAFVSSLKSTIEVIEIDAIRNTDQQLKQKQISSFISNISLKYNLILLDLHFENTNASVEIEETQGYCILKKLSDSNIKIPVIIFSASLKKLDSLNKLYDFVIGHFVKSFSTPNDFVQLVNKAVELNSIAIIIHKLALLESYKGDFYGKINRGSVALRPAIKETILLHINSIRTKLLFVEKMYLEGSGKNLTQINKNIEEIIPLINVIILSFKSSRNVSEPQYEIEEEIRELRNVIVHYFDLKMENNDRERQKKVLKKYNNKNINEKMNDINIYVNLIIKGVLFN